MKIHEYQARRLLTEYQIPVSRYEVVFDAKSARKAFEKVANPNCVVKVQVLMGGRGKAGGIQKAATAEQAENHVGSFIGKTFSTYQSGGSSTVVKSVVLAEMVSIKEEYYLGVVVDRSRQLPVILFCKEGGVEIEEVASARPEQIRKIHFSPEQLPSELAISEEIQKSIPTKNLADKIASIAVNLARLFVEKDASICEINPLVLTEKSDLVAIDAKIVFDDNALFRHKGLQELKDPDEEDERERRAKECGLSYVSMNGNVGCLVNGAGLAMATMDMIKMAGGEPANFLDVGGGATADQVREGFKIILQDPRVEAILVNIFGGIMKCDVIAEGVIQASREIKLRVPLVVRLEGTRVKEGRALLEESGLSIISRSSIKDAAETAVREAKKFSETHVHSNR
jgi:succinyl-CoA synthetase beta subunit